MPVKRLDALELGDILGSLLSSVVDAQTQAARATVTFIEDVAFEQTADGDRLRKVTVKYVKKDKNDDPAEFAVDVPLLTLVNVPSLVVKEAKLSFSYDVVTSTTPDKSATVPAPTKFTSIGGLRPAKLTGFVQRKTPDGTPDKRTTSIDLDVTLEQQELPVGIERLFDLAELGITEPPEPDDT